MFMRWKDNCGDLDGALSMNDAECALEECTLTKCYVGMLIAVEFIVSLSFCACNPTCYYIGISDVKKNMSMEWMSVGFG